MGFLEVAQETTGNMKAMHSNVYHRAEVTLLIWADLLHMASILHALPYMYLSTHFTRHYHCLTFQRNLRLWRG